MVKLTSFTLIFLIFSCEKIVESSDGWIGYRPTSYIKRVSEPHVFELETPTGTKGLIFNTGISAWNSLYNGEPRYIYGGTSSYYSNNSNSSTFLVRFDSGTNEFTWLKEPEEETSEILLFKTATAVVDNDVKIIQGLWNNYSFYSTLYCFKNGNDERLWKKDFEVMSRTGFVLNDDYLWMGTSQNIYTSEENKYYLSKIDKLTGDVVKQWSFPAYIQKVLKFNNHFVLIQMPDKEEYESGIDPLIIHWDPVSEDTIKTIRWPVEDMDPKAFLSSQGPRYYIGDMTRIEGDIWMYSRFASYDAINLQTGELVYQHLIYGFTEDPYSQNGKIYTADVAGIYEIEIKTGKKLREFSLFEGDEGLATTRIAGFHYRYTMTYLDNCLLFNIDYSFIRVDLLKGIYYVERVDKRLNGGDEDFGTGFFYKTSNHHYKVLYHYPNPSPPPIQQVIGEYKWEKNW